MNEKEIIKQLETGSFYMVFDKSKTGHPGMVYWKNDQRNLYLAITTGTSEQNNPHFEKLSKPTSSDVKVSYVNKKPFLGKRRDFGSRKLEKMSFFIGDYEILVKVTRKEPRTGKRVKKSEINFVKTQNTEFKK